MAFRLGSLKQPGAVGKYLVELIRDYHSVGCVYEDYLVHYESGFSGLVRYLIPLHCCHLQMKKISKGVRMIKRHLMRIYENPDQVTDYQMVQCRNLERIDLQEMQVALTGMKIKQLT